MDNWKIEGGEKKRGKRGGERGGKGTHNWDNNRGEERRGISISKGYHRDGPHRVWHDQKTTCNM